MPNLRLVRPEEKKEIAHKHDLLLKFYKALYTAMGQQEAAQQLPQLFQHLHPWHLDLELELLKDGTLRDIVNTMTRPDIPEEKRDQLREFYVETMTPLLHNYGSLTPDRFKFQVERVKREADKIKRECRIPLSDHRGTDAGINRVLRALPDPTPKEAAEPGARKMAPEEKGDNVIDIKPVQSFFKSVHGSYQVVVARPSEKLGEFSIYGDKHEILGAKVALKESLRDDELNGSVSEEKIRLKVQRLIDEKNLKADILYKGNTIYGFNKVMKDFSRIVKGGVEKLTNNLYQFFSLNFTIAHYNKQGWIKTYPTLADVLEVLKLQRKWQADVEKIRLAMVEKLEAEAPKEKTNIIKLRR